MIDEMATSWLWDLISILCSFLMVETVAGGAYFHGPTWRLPALYLFTDLAPPKWDLDGFK